MRSADNPAAGRDKEANSEVKDDNGDKGEERDSVLGDELYINQWQRYTLEEAQILATVHGSQLARYVDRCRVGGSWVYIWTRVHEQGDDRMQQHGER